jgi:tetratricopeptide (TPR) repeat protein
MTITRKARGTEISHRAQRVFFCCDEQNADKKDSLIADLFSMDAGMDCVVSYLEPGDAVDTEALQNELQEHQALVLWVTAQLLESMKNGKTPEEYRLAKELGVPILPVAEYGELFPRFTQIAGAIHGIARSDAEYRVKLKTQLESFLGSEEIIKEIQEKAFSATVFLSYRKMDIQEARSFMKALHDLEGFEAVSVWYDNFLTAGRIFDKEIEDSIIKSDAFVLLVTPNLLEKTAEGKDNYVVSTEYPFARREKKPVLPVEALPTDPGRFAELFPGAGYTISINNLLINQRVIFMQEQKPVKSVKAALNAALREKLGESAYLEQMDSERMYLLGSAYLKGFGLERDFNRGTRLLKHAARGSGSAALSAAEQLAGIYGYGIGTGVDYNQALQWRERAVVLSEQLYGKGHPDTTAAYNNIAGAYGARGYYPQAMEWYHKALAIHEKTPGKEHPDTAATYNGIALVYDEQGDYSQAMEWFQKALTIREKTSGKEDPDTAKIYNDIGEVYYKRGDYPQAMEWFQKALAIKEKVFGGEHPDTAGTYNNMALVYYKRGDYSQAMEWFQKALTIREKTPGKEHPDTAATYNDIAVVYYKRGEYSRALEWYSKALAIREKALGEHPDTALTYHNIAVVYYKRGEYPQALILYKKAAAAYEKVFGKEHPKTALTYHNIAVVYDAQGDYPQALEWYHKALAVYEKVFGKEHPDTAGTYRGIAAAYYKRGDYPRALRWYHKALAILEKTPGKEHPDTA